MNLNIYNPYVREELYLMHHGILGQRWGKKNGPPYPLSAGAHSASEKKAGWRKSLDNDGKTERKIQRLGKKYDKLVLKAEKGNPSKRLLQKMDKAQTKYENAVDKSQKLSRKKLSDTDEIHKKYNKLFRPKVISKEDEKNLQKLYDNRLTPEDRKRLSEAADKIVKAWDMSDKADKMKFRSEKEKDDYYSEIDKVMQEGISVSKDIAKNISKNDKYKTADHFFSGQKLNSSEVATQRTMSDIAQKKVDDKWIKKTGLTQSAYRSYERAAKEDKWNMEFLEMYQPEKWNKNEALAEYKKFLKDPDKWIERQ